MWQLTPGGTQHCEACIAVNGLEQAGGRSRSEVEVVLYTLAEAVTGSIVG